MGTIVTEQHSPVGTAGIQDIEIGRPYGTRNFAHNVPSDKSPGYFRMSLRDEKSRLATKTKKTALTDGFSNQTKIKKLIIRSLGFRAMRIERIGQGLGDHLGRTALEVAALKHSDKLAIL